MSENEDERLDRAKRIRRMREGGGQEDESGAPTGDDGDGTAVTDGATGNEETDGGDGTVDEQGETTPSATDAEDGREPEDATEGNEPEGGEESTPDVTVPETTDIEPETEETSSGDDAGDIRAPLPDSDDLEEALGSSVAEAETTAPGEVTDAATTTPGELRDEDVAEEETRVLEFTLGDEYYCLDIDYIEEIVKEETITRVPNTPEYVEGVVDLRGQITTILNPKVTLEKDDVTPGGLIVVFDSDSFEDQGHIGWIVDDVRQVSPITESDVNDPPVEDDYVNGVIDREDDEQFVIWTEPDMAMEEAE